MPRKFNSETVSVVAPKPLECLTQRCPVAAFINDHHSRRRNLADLRVAAVEKRLAVAQDFDGGAFLSICPAPRCGNHLLVTPASVDST